MPFTIITGGSFTSTGAGVKVPLPSSADYFVTTNVTQLPLAPATGVVIRAEWYGPKFGLGATAANDGIRWKKTNSTNALLIDTFATSTASNGFTYVTSAPVVEAQSASAITAVTAASPAVVSQTNTYSDGDILQFYDTTGMLQIAGMNFQISTTSGSGYTLIGLRAAGFASAATAGFTRRISKFAAVEPQFLYVTEITKATQAVVRTSVDPTQYYAVGMKLHFSVPYSFGMTQMNQLTGKIIAMSAANYTMTVDIDSSAFTTFAFPTSASSPTAQLFATVAPAGASTQFDPVTLVQTGYNFQYQPFRTGEFVPYMFLSGGDQSPAGAAAAQINWRAYKLEN
jgi:hypothetical protein